MSSDQTGPKRPPRPGGGARTPASRPRPASTGEGRATATIAAPSAGSANGSGSAPIDEAPVDDTLVGEVPVEQPEHGPVAEPAAPRPGRRRGRRVKRVVRRVDLWSVLKLSLVVYACLYAAILATLAALWGIAYSSGTIDNLQSFLEDVGLEDFTFYGNQMFRAAAAVGAVGVMAGTVVTVLAAALINVISEITGGIRLVVIEEDVER
ncbi:MAG: DUF3566 domain-containing protein [Acidimicrobiales bacterium]|nr:DUF3566 domain-containing protein [Acidimicrobiales bacterium]HRW36585.1 DUF3566 domain-containing protein [Aquihabitans sp.]